MFVEYFLVFVCFLQDSWKKSFLTIIKIILTVRILDSTSFFAKKVLQLEKKMFFFYE